MIPWRRERLPTPVFWPRGFGNPVFWNLEYRIQYSGLENAGDLGSNPGLGISPGEEGIPTPVIWSGEFHGQYSPWGHKESDMTEWLLLLPNELRTSFH